MIELSNGDVIDGLLHFSRVGYMEGRCSSVARKANGIVMVMLLKLSLIMVL